MYICRVDESLCVVGGVGRGEGSPQCEFMIIVALVGFIEINKIHKSMLSAPAGIHHAEFFVYTKSFLWLNVVQRKSYCRKNV